MPVEGRRGNPHKARGIHQGEAADAALGDEAARGLDQRLLEVAVMVAAPVFRPVPPMSHTDLPALAPSRVTGRAGREGYRSPLP